MLTAGGRSRELTVGMTIGTHRRYEIIYTQVPTVTRSVTVSQSDGRAVKRFEEQPASAQR